MAQVKCSVRNCHYWGEGQVCEADEIEVAVTGSAGARMDAGRMGDTAADHSEETCCVTFRPRGGERAGGR